MNIGWSHYIFEDAMDDIDADAVLVTVMADDIILDQACI